MPLKKKKAVPEFSISKINIEKSSKRKINKERNRIYQVRHRIKKKLKDGNLSKQDQKELHNKIIQSTRFLDACRERLGTKLIRKKEVGFKKEAEVSKHEGRQVLIESIYVWEAVGVISDLIDQAFEIKTYFIDKVEYKRRQSIAIISATEDMVTEAELRGEYYFILTTDYQRKSISLDFDK